jgi:DNA (cytosine-5)-methyltransferase 1
MLKFIDLFCGIGGFRYALEGAARERGIACECVLSSDIDPYCGKAYKGNFGEDILGDIRKVDAKDVPDHDILLAGFPCQPFSIIGSMKGFEDTRGTLFFEIARILEAKRPSAFVLENVKRLKGHDGGRTLKKILATLRALGYKTDFRILNALDFGLPQRRERIWIVGFRDKLKFKWPEGGVPMKPLDEILERDVPKKFYASERIKGNRMAFKRRKSHEGTTIWHENKSGHVSASPFSCALRAGASYNYLLVNGERRLTPREMLRLQGFPEEFKELCSDFQTRKQAGNSLPVNVAQAVLGSLFDAWKNSKESKQ